MGFNAELQVMGRAALVAVALAGCQGSLDAGPLGPTGPGTITPRTDGSFACTPGAAPSATPLRRLSILQYENTLNDLFAGMPGLDPQAVAGTALTRLPADDVGATFRGMDDRLSDRHVQGFYDVADAMAAAAIASDANLTSIAGSCALASSASASCVDRFLDGFVTRAFRRPLTSEERTRYHAIDDGTRTGREVFRALVFSVLMAPQLVYHVEVDGQAQGSETRLALGPYELASRLSYHFWQSMPDAELFAAAADGSLMTDAGYRAQVQRIFESPRTRETVTTFYSEWFQLGAVTFRPSAPFTTFAADAHLDAPGADHLAAAEAEIVDLTSYYTWERPGTFRDLLVTNLTFNRSPFLADLYGVAPWDGHSAPVELPAAERSGILTRAAFLISGTYTTHPIHRGAVVRRRIMCETLAQPSAAALPPGSLTPPPPDSSLTTRQRFETKVRSEPCASCHAQMNPIGYVLEQYDALGRFRTEEQIYDELTGMQVNTLPIDSRSSPHLTPTDGQTIETGTALSQLVADSGRAESCFAMEYFRFTHHRAEAPSDGCALETVRTALVNGNLREALMAIALDPSFRERVVE